MANFMLRARKYHPAHTNRVNCVIVSEIWRHAWCKNVPYMWTVANRFIIEVSAVLYAMNAVSLQRLVIIGIVCNIICCCCFCFSCFLSIYHYHHRLFLPTILLLKTSWAPVKTTGVITINFILHTAFCVFVSASVDFYISTLVTIMEKW